MITSQLSTLVRGWSLLLVSVGLIMASVTAKMAKRLSTSNQIVQLSRQSNSFYEIDAQVQQILPKSRHLSIPRDSTT
jgi:hypothetical protein